MLFHRCACPLFAVLLLAVAGACPCTRAGGAENATDSALQNAWAGAAYVRGLPFKSKVPVEVLTSAVLRRLVDEEISDMFPGETLAGYIALWSWLSLIPPDLNLREAHLKFLEKEAAGVYDAQAKVLYVAPDSDPQADPAETFMGRWLVLTHECIHALDDQHVDIDAGFRKRRDRSDALTAYQALAEGTATRGMIHAFPGSLLLDGPASQRAFFAASNLVLWPPADWLVGAALVQVQRQAKSVDGVPDALVQSALVPYVLGYRFVQTLQQNYGLDGVDRAYAQPPETTEQMLHPVKYWEWRDWPCQVTLPASPPCGEAPWKALRQDEFGEAGVALFYDILLGRGHGAGPARGWDGDRVGLYEDTKGRRLLLWASAWDSAADAAGFAAAWRKTVKKTLGGRFQKSPFRCRWTRDGKEGILYLAGKHVVIVESETPGLLDSAVALVESVRFDEPAAETLRDAANPWLVRSNPVFSWRRDADYVRAELGWGLLYRADRNDQGGRDSLLAGLLFSRRGSRTYGRGDFLWGFGAEWDSNARQGWRHLDVLPFGLLWSQDRSQHPFQRERVISQQSVLWGCVARREVTVAGDSFRLLPWGLLLRWEHDAAARLSVRVLGIPLYRAQR